MKDLALFPLPIVLLPGEKTTLHIFEPRYRQLLEDVEAGSGFFGIPYIAPKEKESGPGSLVKLIEVQKRYVTGESDILIQAIDLFDLVKIYENKREKLYTTGDIEVWKDYREWPIDEVVRDQYLKLLDILGAESFDGRLADHTFEVLSYLHMNHADRVKFLSVRDKQKQEVQLKNLLRFTALIVEQEQKKEFDFYMN